MRRFMNVLLAVLASPIVLASSAKAETGVTDKEIVIGAHTIETGAGSDKMALQYESFFDDINKAGGVNGRKIKFIHIDGSDVVARAVEATKKLVEQENVFAMVGSGPPFAHAAVWKYLVEKNVPDMWFFDGLTTYLEQFHKTVFPGLPSYKGEAETVAKYYLDQAKGKKICFLTSTSEGGQTWKKGVEEFYQNYNKTADDKSKVTIAATETAVRFAVNVNPEVLRLKRAGCDTVFYSLLPSTFAQAVNFGIEQGFTPKIVVWSINAQIGYIQMLKESARDGIVGAQAIAKSAFGKDDANWKKVEAFAEKHGYQSSISSVPQAMFVGELFVEALKRAGKDLTREKFLAAAESLGGFKCTTCLTPVDLSPTNHWAFLKPKVTVFKKDHWEIVQ